MVPVRLRAGSSWMDACVLNVSSRGLLVRSPKPAERGSYVELRRDDQVIVARVVWRCGSRMGMRAQDKVPVEALVTARSKQSGLAIGECRPVTERRRKRRAHDRSRQSGRTMEFVSVGLIGATLCAAAFGMVAEGFARPLATVGAALSTQASLSADSR